MSELACGHATHFGAQDTVRSETLLMARWRHTFGSVAAALIAVDQNAIKGLGWSTQQRMYTHRLDPQWRCCALQKNVGASEYSTEAQTHRTVLDHRRDAHRYLRVPANDDATVIVLHVLHDLPHTPSHALVTLLRLFLVFIDM